MQKITENDHEVSQAEFHLNQDLPAPRTVGLIIGVFLVLAAVKTAGAATLPDTCSTQLKTLQFAGTFNLKSPRLPKSGPMRFVIGQPQGGAPGSAVAQIWSGDRCQASCSSLDFEKGATSEEGGSPVQSMPISLDLQCRGEELGQLSAHVAVLWSYGSKPSTLLRFGSWLEGYEQAAMKVEVDHFNSMNLASRADHDMPPSRPKTLAVSQ